MQFIVLEQGFEGVRLNTGTMNGLPTLAATLLANFATVRIPRCESLWISSVPNPSPKHRYRLLSRALTGETLIMSCHRQHLRYRLLEPGHRRAVDQTDGGCTSSAASRRPSGYCMTSASGSVVLAMPRHSIPSSSLCIGSANWSVLVASTRQMDGGTGTRERAVLCRHTVPSCIPIVRMVCLSEPESVIAFGIDEARRDLRPIKS